MAMGVCPGHILIPIVPLPLLTKEETVTAYRYGNAFIHCYNISGTNAFKRQKQSFPTIFLSFSECRIFPYSNNIFLWVCLQCFSSV